MSLRFASPLQDREDDDLAVLAQGGDRQAQQVLISATDASPGPRVGATSSSVGTTTTSSRRR